MITDGIPRSLNTFFDWLERHRSVNAALVLAYVAFILFGHDTFVHFSIVVMNALTLPVYNMVVGAITVSVGLTFVGFLFFFLRKKSSDRPMKALYLGAILLMLVLHHFVLFEMNIEVIHAGLYAGLAVLLFPFGRRFGAPLVYALPIMFLDEWYQYRILYPDYVEYLELNDIVIDLLGSALMLCGLWVIGVRDRPAHRSFFLRTEGILFMAMAAVAAMLLTTSLVVPFPDDATERTLLVMSRLPDPQGFWSVHAFTGRTYHVLQPITGLVVIAVLVLLGQGMGTRIGQEADQVAHK
jgi:hypothetical protein